MARGSHRPSFQSLQAQTAGALQRLHKEQKAMRTSSRQILFALAAAAFVGGCDNTSLFENQTPFLTGTGTGSNATSTAVTVSASSTSAAATTPVSISVSATQGGVSVADNTTVTFSTNFGFFTDSSS